MENTNLATVTPIQSEDMELFSNEYPFRLPLRIREFQSDAEYKRFIKNCELLIRKSVEYSQWKDYVRDVLLQTTCKLTHENLAECTVDIHHHIPSLYLMVKAILNKFLDEERQFCSFDIALEVIQIHFQNRLGFVTLLKSLHEKFHNGYLQIPTRLVYGDYQYFLDNYLNFLEEDDINSINERLNVLDTNLTWERNNYPGISPEVQN